MINLTEFEILVNFGTSVIVAIVFLAIVWFSARMTSQIVDKRINYSSQNLL